METSKILKSVESEFNQNTCAITNFNKMNILNGEVNGLESALSKADDNKIQNMLEMNDGEVNNQKGTKRSATPLEDDMPVSKFRHVETPTELFQLEQFCDEILFEIFRNLDTWSLLSLKNCNQRFSALIMDNRFWKNIDLAKSSLPLGLLVYVLERVHNKTHTLKLCGPSLNEQKQYHIDIFNKKFYTSIFHSGINLTVLELEQIRLDFEIMRLALLRATLKRLVISHCEVRDLHNHIFAGIDHYLVNLAEFGCEFNPWFRPCFLLSLSKLPNLIRLSLRGCNQMSEFVPYGSLASRFGFRTLEYLDLRMTPLTDSDLQCFNALSKIKVLLLDSPEISEENTCPAGPIVNTTPKKALNPNERLAAYLSEAYEKNEKYVTVIKVEHNSEEPKERPLKRNQVYEISSKEAKNIETDYSQSEEKESSTNNIDTNEPLQKNVNHVEPSCSKTKIDTKKIENLQQSEQDKPLNLKMNGEPKRFKCESTSSNSIPFSSANNVTDEKPSTSKKINNPDADDPEPEKISLQNNRESVGLPDNPSVEALEDISPPPANNQIIVVRLGPAANAYNHFDRLMNHPIFWNMLHAGQPQPNVENVNNPQAGAENAQNPPARPRDLSCQIRYSVGNRAPSVEWNTSRLNRELISDRGICSFGRPHNQVDRQIVWIRLAQSPMENTLEKLTLRNYKLVSDITLRHLVQCSPHLIYLDISGTSITLEGVRAFSAQKPLCNIIAQHLRGWSPESSILEPDPFVF